MQHATMSFCSRASAGPAARRAVCLLFVLGHRAVLFGGAPVVFVSLRPPGAVSPVPADITGTWFSVDWQANLDLILRLQPDTKRVAVVYGTSAFDRNETGKIRDAFVA